MLIPRQRLMWLMRRAMQIVFGGTCLIALGAFFISPEKRSYLYLSIILGGFMIVSVWAERHGRKLSGEMNDLNSQQRNAPRNRRALIFYYAFIAILVAAGILLTSKVPSGSDVLGNLANSFLIALLFEIVGICIIVRSVRAKKEGLRDEVYRLTIKYKVLIDEKLTIAYCNLGLIWGWATVSIPVFGIYLGWDVRLWALLFIVVNALLEYLVWRRIISARGVKL
jgi:hypothetical protein